MEKKIEYNGHQFWIRVEPALYKEKTVFIAYVNDEQPGAFYYGETVKDGNGNPMRFETDLAAFMNARDIKQNELDEKDNPGANDGFIEI